MEKTKLFFLTGFLLVMSSVCHATDWPVYPDERNGMTGPQQITNALTQLTNGDTIRLSPGRYDLSDVAMRIDTFKSDNVTYVITNRLYRGDIVYSLVGDTEGHWDDAVILTGGGRCLDARNTSCKVTIRNLTFDGFDCNRYPCGGSFESRGGALRLQDSRTDTGSGFVSNCVIRNSSAYIAGAVNGGYMIDCCLTNNYSSYNGGAGSNSSFVRCHVGFNRAGNACGASYNVFVCEDSLFEGNSSSSGIGALIISSPTKIRNCVFKGNISNSSDGGALKVTAPNGFQITNCVFIGNSSAKYGGAIYFNSSATTQLVSDCEFEENVATNGGGAIYVDGQLVPSVNRCTFRKNFSVTSGGGAIRYAVSSFEKPCSGCLFEENFTLKSGDYIGGGAAYNGVYTNCVFLDNVVSNGGNNCGGGAIYMRNEGGVYDCIFTGNKVWTNGNGGAVYSQYTIPTPIVGCAFTNNYAWESAGAVYCGFCTNCIFSENRSCIRGAAIYGWYGDPYNPDTPLYAEAVDCVFTGNLRRDNTGRQRDQHTEYSGGDAGCTRLIRCDLSDGSGCLYRCQVVNSRLHHYTNSLGYSVFGEESWVTNCLIDHCDLSKVGCSLFTRSHYFPNGKNVWYRGRDRGSWVNCTFADNMLSKVGFIGKPTYIENGEKVTNPIDFINCVFYNNRKPGNVLADISGQQVCGVTYSNCLYGACDNSLVLDGVPGWEDKGGNIVSTTPKFAAERSDKLNLPWYALLLGSPACRRGDASLFSASDRDLAGELRLRDGKVDLGCYACWLLMKGTVIFLF